MNKYNFELWQHDLGEYPKYQSLQNVEVGYSTEEESSSTLVHTRVDISTLVHTRVDISSLVHTHVDISSLVHIVRRNIEQIAQRVKMLYRLFLSIDMSS